jgi:thiopeptide-type bacteriocin biosynthesis protein
MPTTRVSFLSDRMAAIVEAVLAGAPADTIAAEAGIDPTDVDTAVQTYRAAGQAALQAADNDAWFHASIELPNWSAAEAHFAAHIAPRLDQLDGGSAAWWFLRKHPHWRVRLRTTDNEWAAVLLGDLTDAGTIAAWKPGFYEPETAAFGGPVAMAIVHDLFCADSRGVLAHSRHEPPSIGRREISLLLIRALQHRAGLDWYETADVFDRVAHMRPAPSAADETRLDALAAKMQPLLALPADARVALFTDGPLGHANEWMEAFATAGQKLGEAAANACLDRGLRAILAHIVIFHWNRLGLAARTQGILARAATTAILPRS